MRCDLFILFEAILPPPCRPQKLLTQNPRIFVLLKKWALALASAPFEITIAQGARMARLARFSREPSHLRGSSSCSKSYRAHRCRLLGPPMGTPEPFAGILAPRT